ncbi:MAG: FKBP-type peptidyl-prolyl cis-trans isomerase [Bacteroidota bacterium]
MPGFYRIHKISAFAIAVLISACDPPVQKQTTPQQDQQSEQFVKANQYMQRRHQDHIAAFVERVKWDARVTPSGLWLVEKKPGSGPEIELNSKVTYSFESMLLDGTPCYEATDEKPKVITIGIGGVESGVEQGLQLMRQGTEAILLIPPHLAHGNFGDRDKIPGNRVLIYHVKVLEVQ